MSLIAQISDLHFGREIQDTVDALSQWLNQQKLDLIIVSGDLTQRAKVEEFEKAKIFLQQLKAPLLCIPGNHDVPLYDVMERFLSPYKRYKEFISKDLCPTVITDDLCVVGINTAHGRTFAGGRIPKNLTHAVDVIKKSTKNQLKVLVAHHPIDPWPLVDAENSPVPLKDRIQTECFRELPFDLLMTGHHHKSRITLSQELYGTAHSPFVMSMAGTTLSSRKRGEENSFHLFDYKHPVLNAEQKTWDPDLGDYKTTQLISYIRSETAGWGIST